MIWVFRGLFLLLWLSIFTSAWATMGFENIRKESNYWMPYEMGEGVMVVINRTIDTVTDEERKEIDEAYIRCKSDVDPPVYKYFWIAKGRVEGIATKNWPELYRANYPADVNEIMLKCRKQIINIRNPVRMVW